MFSLTSSLPIKQIKAANSHVMKQETKGNLHILVTATTNKKLSFQMSHSTGWSLWIVILNYDTPAVVSLLGSTFVSGLQSMEQFDWANAGLTIVGFHFHHSI